MFNFAKYLEIRFKSSSVTFLFGLRIWVFGPRRPGLQSYACASRMRSSGPVAYAMRVYLTEYGTKETKDEDSKIQ